MLRVLLIVLVLGGVIAVVVGDSGSMAGIDGGTIAALVASICLLIFIGYPLLANYAGGLPKAVNDALIWLAIALVLVIGYAFRDDVKRVYERVAGELLPPGYSVSVSDTTEGKKAIRIRRRPNGHFVARTEVNGAEAIMLVDTGATTTTLTPNDARAAGINLAKLNYAIPVRTANGLTYAAATRISRLAVGPIEMFNIDVLVSKPGAMHQSLLGMNFLTRLRSYEFSGDFLTLRS